MEKVLQIVHNNESIERIDRALTTQFPNYSRSYFQQLIFDKCVALNGAIVTKPSMTLKMGDIIEVTLPPVRELGALPLPAHDLGVSILYEHEDFLIICKPASLLVHAPHTQSDIVTLVDWLVHTFKELKSVGYADRPGIVHRLDKDTSGLLIVPRNNQAHAHFSNLFAQRQIQKKYLAVVSGNPVESGSIDLTIGRHPTLKHKMAPVQGHGREALTHYKVIEYFKDAALLEVSPVTGRTHQIRVHCAALGHPILGDTTYGTEHPSINRQALHAYRLSFEYKEHYYAFSYTMPEDMQALIADLRTSSSACQ